TGVGRVDAVDAEDAVLVQADVDDVCVPGGDGRDRRVVARDVEDATALHARVLVAGAVDAVQVNGLVRAVEQRVARDVEAREGRWRRRAARWRWRWRRWTAVRVRAHRACR